MNSCCIYTHLYNLEYGLSITSSTLSIIQVKFTTQFCWSNGKFVTSMLHRIDNFSVVSWCTVPSKLTTVRENSATSGSSIRPTALRFNSKKIKKLMKHTKVNFLQTNLMTVNGCPPLTKVIDYQEICIFIWRSFHSHV